MKSNGNPSSFITDEKQLYTRLISLDQWSKFATLQPNLCAFPSIETEVHQVNPFERKKRNKNQLEATANNNHSL